MDIQQIKGRLDILEVASHLGIEVDKRSKKACCPFHNDKTPSLQFSQEKQIATCFSSNCNAGTMDVVELVKKYNKWELPETLRWLQEQAGVYENGQPQQSNVQINDQERTQTLTQLFETFTRSFASSGKPQHYLQSRNLDPRKVKAGYNIGQFHHTVNLPSEASAKVGLLNQYEALGLIKKVGSGYSVFGKGCVVFPLRNRKGQIMSFYFRETSRTKKNQHYYLKNRQGLYPGYPKRGTKKLVLSESILDTETLLQTPEILQGYEILACYGTEGIREQLEAVKELDELQEVVIFFDGDNPGKEGSEKLAKAVLAIHPTVKVKIVETPEDQDVNSLIEGHDREILQHLIKEANPFFLSVEESAPKTVKEPSNEKAIERKKAPHQAPENLYTLDTHHPHNLKYRTETADYEIKGGIGKNGLDRLIISLHIIQPETRKKSRVRLDLYEDKQVEKTARESGEKLELRSDQIEADLNHLADLLDEQREQEYQAKEQEEPPKYHVIPETEKREAFDLLTGKGKYKGNISQHISELIGHAGVEGEEGNRAFLFCIASSHKMPETLHALVQGSSGSGKTHLVRQIADLMPEENVIRLTRVTESSFYNYGEYDLQNKLVVIEDYDGLKEEAELAFRELQSGDELRSQVSGKDTEYGSYRTQVRVVKGPISSMAATTRGAIYEDNLSRCFVLAVDESKEQTASIINYQNRKAAGEIDTSNQGEIKTLLQNCIRLLKPLPVINPYASKLNLPEEAFKIRRLNSNFQSFVKQITLLNQYQRKKDAQGRLITEKQDLTTAIEIMFDSIVLKVDELDGSLRDFYERVKSYITEKGREYAFTQREIRQTLRVSKTQMHRFISDLLELEYLQQSGGYANRGYKYKIIYWDDMEKLRARIKDELTGQLLKL